MSDTTQPGGIGDVHRQFAGALDAGEPVVIPLGRLVVCDRCDKDFTDSGESGGFLFGSYAYGPCCAAQMLDSIRGYGEEWNIRGTCPPGMAFADWIREGAGGPREIRITPG